MAIQTNTNINPVPVIDEKEYQLHRQLWSDRLPVYIPYDRLLPFQIVTDSTYTTLNIEVYDIHDNLIKSISYLQASVVKLNGGDNLTNWTCLSVQLNASIYLPTDKIIYFKYIFATQEQEETYYYSEICKAIKDVNQLIKLEWWNKKDIEFGDYVIKSKIEDYYLLFRTYINSEIGLPQYPYEEEVINRESNEFILSIISDKKYKINMVVTEPYMDSLRLARLADYIAITYRNTLYKVQAIKYSDIEWLERGGVGKLEITFTVDNIIKKLGTAKPTRGDFGDDYDNDFANQV